MIVENEMGQALVHRAQLQRTRETAEDLTHGPVLDKAPLLRFFGGGLDLLQHFVEGRCFDLLLKDWMGWEAMSER